MLSRGAPGHTAATYCAAALACAGAFIVSLGAHGVAQVVGARRIGLPVAMVGRLTSWIIVGSAIVALVAGARVEGLWLLVTGWVLLDGARSHRGECRGPQTS